MMQGILANYSPPSHKPVPPAGGTSDAYGTAVTNISGLVAFWRLGDETTAALADSSGNGHSGSYIGSPAPQEQSLTAPWQASDGRSVNFDAAGYGEVTSVAALATARGTLSFYFRPTAASLTNEHFLVCKDDSGANPNQLTVYCLSDGTLRARFQHNGSNTAVLDSHPDVIEVGVEYHVVVMWDELAVWLVLDGRVLAWSMAHQGGLVGNTVPWQFGRTFWNSTNSDVILDEVALFNRRLTWGEVDILSEFVRGIAYNPAAMNNVGPFSNVTDIENALAAADPGDRILVANGTYDNLGPITLTNSGAKWNPIVLAPQNAGQVTFTNAEIILRNRWFIIDGINLNQSNMRPNASDCRYWRVARSTTTDLNGVNGSTDNNDGFLEIRGCFGRSDHHSLQHAPTSVIPIIHHVRVEQSGDAAGNNALLGSYNLFDHCAVGPIDGSLGGGDEFLAIGQNPIDGRQWMSETVYRNRGVSQLSDEEYVSGKSSGNIFIGNTWLGPLQPSPGNNYHRHGGYSWYESEWYEVRTRILGGRNVFIGCHATQPFRFWTGDTDFATWDAGSFAGTNYPQCFENVVVGCTLDGTSFDVGVNVVGTEIVTDTSFYDCPPASINGTWSTGTVESATAPVPYVAAVELTAGDVGPSATDPLVPPGWK